MTCIELTVGPPGTGKTTKILNRVDGHREAGVSTREIAVVSFSRAAVRNAIERAAKRFGLDPDTDFPYWRTIHGMARKLSPNSSPVAEDKHWKQFGEEYSYTLTSERIEEEGIPLFRNIRSDSDVLRQIAALSRYRRCSVEDAILSVPNRPLHLGVRQVKKFMEEWTRFKRENDIIDFSDMLEQALRSDNRPVGVRFAFVDETQDCSKLQTDLIEKWFFDGPETTTIVGDDDQVIFTWAGADSAWLHGLSERYPTRVLEQSWRVPRRMHGMAENIITQVRHRIPKVYRPRDAEGEILRFNDTGKALGAINGGTGCVLARNKYLLAEAYESLVSAGELFKTRAGKHAPIQNINNRKAFAGLGRLRNFGEMYAKDLSAFLTHVKIQGTGVLPRGVASRIDEMEGGKTLSVFDLQKMDALEFARRLTGEDPFDLWLKLDETKRSYWNRLWRRFPSGNLPDEADIPIELSTIHRYKGEEADTVVLISDMARASFAELASRDPSPEHRVAYVAVTRAKERLVLMEPQSRRHYSYARYARGRSS